MSNNDIDLNWKNDTIKNFYDIEVLPSLFTCLMLEDKKRVNLIMSAHEEYDNVASDKIQDVLERYVRFVGKDFPSLINLDELEVSLYRFPHDLTMPITDGKVRSIPGEDAGKLSGLLDTILSGLSINTDGLTDYYGYNSSNYDLPMLCVASILLETHSFSTQMLRRASNILINSGEPQWRFFYLLEDDDSTSFPSGRLRTRENIAYYADRHIDIASILRVYEEGGDSRFPPSLKKEMAKAGMDIVIDDNVANDDVGFLSEKELLDVICYNFNDVLGTAYLGNTGLVKSGLGVLDSLREQYPFTSAKGWNYSPEKNKYKPKTRDITPSELSALILVGKNRDKISDKEKISYEFPLPSGKQDLLEYMREKEAFFPEKLYEFFKHFRGENSRSWSDHAKLVKEQPITHSATMNVPYYRDGQPLDCFARPSNGGCHGGVYAGLSEFDDKEVEEWIIANKPTPDSSKVTIDAKNVLHVDWSSFYPTLSIKLETYKLPDGTDNMAEMTRKNLELKAELTKELREGNPELFNKKLMERNGLKLGVNSPTGYSNRHKEGSLLDLDNATLSMRLIGNMLIWCMGQRLAQAGAFIISTNTDGLYITGISLKECEKVINEYVADYGMPVEPEVIARFVNRDTSTRLEFDEAGNVTSSKGELKHGVSLDFDDESIGKNVPYPLAVGYGVIEYIRGDEDWISKPYNCGRMVTILENIRKNSDVSAWFSVYSGTSARQLYADNVPLDKVSRFCLTKSGSKLSVQTARLMAKDEMLGFVETGSFEGLGLRPHIYDEDKHSLCLMLRVGSGEYSFFTDDLSEYLKEMDRDSKMVKDLILGYKTEDGASDVLKVWKEQAISGFPDFEFATLLPSRESLKAFDLADLNFDAYVEWAESLLSKWKRTGNISELGLKKCDDSVGKFNGSSRRAKPSRGQLELESLLNGYSNFLDTGSFLHIGE